MKNLQVMYSKKSDNWRTPLFLYRFFQKKGYYDPCPYEANIDGLSIEWEKYNFVNPPYSDISNWTKKCIIEAEKGNIIYLLIPSRTDTRYFHKLMEYHCNFYFFKGRLKFSDSGSAPFPSVLIKISKYINSNYIGNINIHNFKEVIK